MNAKDVIRKVQEDASEWLEMTDDPYAVVAMVLATEVIKLSSHIEYLEKRLHHAQYAGRIYPRNA